MLVVVLRSDVELPQVADRMDDADVFCTTSFRLVPLLESVRVVALSRRHKSVPPSSMSMVRRRRRYAYLFRAALWYRSPSRNRGWGKEFGFGSAWRAELEVEVTDATSCSSSIGGQVGEIGRERVRERERMSRRSLADRAGCAILHTRTASLQVIDSFILIIQVESKSRGNSP